MSALFFYLLKHPDCYEKLALEIRSTFERGAQIKSGPVLASCSYLRACIDETLRMSPPGSGTFWRELSDNDTEQRGPLIIDGHIVAPGTQVGVCTYAIHHNPDYFPDPFTFKPDRWLGKNATARQFQAFAPFSLGSRACAGKTLAYLEISLTVAKTLWYFDFEQPQSGDMSDEGGRRLSFGRNRGRDEEFRMYDIFSAAHKGPLVSFETRGDYWTDLA
jgi:cytochrome P450